MSYEDELRQHGLLDDGGNVGADAAGSHSPQDFHVQLDDEQMADEQVCFTVESFEVILLRAQKHMLLECIPNVQP